MHQQCAAARLQYPIAPGHCRHILEEAPVHRRCLAIVYEVLHCLSSQPRTPCVLPFGELLVSEGVNSMVMFEPESGIDYRISADEALRVSKDDARTR